MSNKTNEYVTIDGRKYKVVTNVTKHKKRVTVYNANKHSTFFHSGPRKNYLVDRTVLRGVVLWFGPDGSPPIEDMVQDALSEAVSIRERNEAKDKNMEERVEGAIDNVKTVYDE